MRSRVQYVAGPPGLREHAVGERWVAGAGEIRDGGGTIIGAGGKNGGNNDLNEVSLTAISGSYPNDTAVSDGNSNDGVAQGVQGHWLAGTGVWQPSDGSTTI